MHASLPPHVARCTLRARAMPPRRAGGANAASGARVSVGHDKKPGLLCSARGHATKKEEKPDFAMHTKFNSRLNLNSSESIAALLYGAWLLTYLLLWRNKRNPGTCSLFLQG